MRLVASCAALLLSLPLCAQVQDESAAPARAYNLLRENDDRSFLADPSLRSNVLGSDGEGRGDLRDRQRKSGALRRLHE